jgi:Spy/CpxP family protein refolding chaperone
LHEQRRQTYARAHTLLMTPVDDRAALEQLRTAHVQQFDAGSRRILEAVADAADVLTPEQRLRFAGHLRQLMH